jgi:DNA-binding transcriptional MocR family regulator
LCEVAIRFNLPIIADEVYNLLNYTSLIGGKSDSCQVPMSMSALGYPNVISMSSFSKILAPGLRVGFIEFPTKEYADKFNRLGFFCSGSNPGQFASCIVLKTIDTIDTTTGSSVLYTHIQRLRCAYASRYTALTKAILEFSAKLLPAGVENQLLIEGIDDANRPVGGYFIWVKMPIWAISVEKNGETVVDPSVFVALAREKYR